MAGVKKLAIFHHDPQHSDKFLDEIWIKHRNGKIEDPCGVDSFWAREGMTIAI
jgi:hypothetical protein